MKWAMDDPTRACTSCLTANLHARVDHEGANRYWCGYCGLWGVLIPKKGKQPMEVKTGQQYRDNDKRCRGRVIEVREVSGDYVRVSSSYNGKWTTRLSRISINRLLRGGSTGYTLIK